MLARVVGNLADRLAKERREHAEELAFQSELTTHAENNEKEMAKEMKDGLAEMQVIVDEAEEDFDAALKYADAFEKERDEARSGERSLRATIVEMYAAAAAPSLYIP